MRRASGPRSPQAEPGPPGTDRVEFEVSTNPGAPFGPLTRIASGGELSRFILALKVALAEAGSAATMIFDEIDRGVGGAVASAIGERLARLAQQSQVLVVTHSPQVAARAAHHYRIEKTHEARRHPHHGAQADADERREEIARMLSGAADHRRSPRAGGAAAGGGMTRAILDRAGIRGETRRRIGRRRDRPRWPTVILIPTVMGVQPTGDRLCRDSWSSLATTRFVADLFGKQFRRVRSAT